MWVLLEVSWGCGEKVMAFWRNVGRRDVVWGGLRIDDDGDNDDDDDDDDDVREESAEGMGGFGCMLGCRVESDVLTGWVWNAARSLDTGCVCWW